MTNNHVIENSSEITITLNDGSVMPAKLIGTDQRSDLALLKVSADDLPTVKIGDSKQLKIGEWVLAIGSPFGFDHTVTAGIVSGKKEICRMRVMCHIYKQTWQLILEIQAGHYSISMEKWLV